MLSSWASEVLEPCPVPYVGCRFMLQCCLLQLGGMPKPVLTRYFASSKVLVVNSATPLCEAILLLLGAAMKCRKIELCCNMKFASRSKLSEITSKHLCLLPSYVPWCLIIGHASWSQKFGPVSLLYWDVQCTILWKMFGYVVAHQKMTVIMLTSINIGSCWCQLWDWLCKQWIFGCQNANSVDKKCANALFCQCNSQPK